MPNPDRNQTREPEDKPKAVSLDRLTKRLARLNEEAEQLAEAMRQKKKKQ